MQKTQILTLMIVLSWTHSWVKTPREARLSRMMMMMMIRIVLSGFSLRIRLIYKDKKKRKTNQSNK